MKPHILSDFPTPALFPERSSDGQGTARAGILKRSSDSAANILSRALFADPGLYTLAIFTPAIHVVQTADA